MDLIGNVKHIENKLGGRNQYQARNKLAPKNNHSDEAKNPSQPEVKNITPLDDECKLGRNIDTSA